MATTNRDRVGRRWIFAGGLAPFVERQMDSRADKARATVGGEWRPHYPIHPELFDRLNNDWGSLERFQRTRGVLRLMANVIHCLWERGDKSLMILPSSVPLDDALVQSRVTRLLEQRWDAIISADIDGNTSKPLAIQRGIIAQVGLRGAPRSLGQPPRSPRSIRNGASGSPRLAPAATTESAPERRATAAPRFGPTTGGRSWQARGGCGAARLAPAPDHQGRYGAARPEKNQQFPNFREFFAAGANFHQPREVDSMRHLRPVVRCA
jgi:hypothetical protein